MFDFWTSIGTGLGVILLVVAYRLYKGESFGDIFKCTTNTDIKDDDQTPQ